MKKLFLTASLLLTPFLTHAQTNKGQGIWTGSVSFTHTYQKDEVAQNKYVNNTPDGFLSFSRGVFFKDNWLMGGGLSMRLQATRSRSTNVFREDTYRASTFYPELTGFVRRYWGKEKWRVFLGGGVSLGYSRTNFEHSRNTLQSPDETSFSLAPIAQVGFTYYLTDRIGLEAAATSRSFPFVASGVGFGLVILTGVTTSTTPEGYEAPQTTKGRWVLGGTLDFMTRTQTENTLQANKTTTTTFSISPSIGWFVQKNLLLGVQVPFSMIDYGDQSVLGYGVSPYLKKYVTDRRLRPFISGSLIYSRSRNKSSSDTVRSQAFGLSASAGLAYLLGDRFIVEANLGSVYFNKAFLPESVNSSAWNGGLRASLQPGFTVQYVFD